MSNYKHFRIEDPQVTALVNLLLRKGFCGDFTISGLTNPPLTGTLEQCIANALWQLQPPAGNGKSLKLDTALWDAGPQRSRQCRLMITYDGKKGFLIQSLELTTPAGSRLLNFSHNEEVPFLRSLQDMPISQPRWPRRVTTWLKTITRKRM